MAPNAMTTAQKSVFFTPDCLFYAALPMNEAHAVWCPSLGKVINRSEAPRSSEPTCRRYT